ncbi:signal peptidase II [Actinopolyspora mzabensis]|uniref:Lipoprotein signal peptidase n=1 Tax=Actinopolyspora mzabensis TaxID=995066 RepID=A0A1G8YXC8_ACTMZ|nr:signal peptidase II [Actinopolyspora mzabensis]SDK07512.1 signal peptidase II [Actinopolyspora mzabensis]
MSDEHHPSDPSGPARPAPGSATERRGPPRPRLLVLLFGIAVVLIGADTITKSLAVAELDDREPVKLFGGALYLVLFRNPGAAFNIGTGLTWLLALLAIVVIGVIIWFAPKLRSTGWAVGIGLVLGGACGNLVDRIFREPAPLRGHVIDFLSVLAPDGSVWPVFNLADSGIVCGGVLIVLLALLGYDYDGTVHRRGAEQGTGSGHRDGPTAGGGRREAADGNPSEGGTTSSGSVEEQRREDGEESS